jgi:signal transduction histidine kinase
MYRAEVQSILSNLMSNALKAVEKGGRVAIEAEESQNSLHIFVSNTGAPVDVKSSERLFLPYVSDSQTPDPALHQGMGLGLPITRQLVEDYGGAVFFDHPRGTFATTVHIEIPN